LAHDCQPAGSEDGADGEGDADGEGETEEAGEGVLEGAGEAVDVAAGEIEARGVAEAAGSASTEQPAASTAAAAASMAMSWVRRWADCGRFIGSLLGGSVPPWSAQAFTEASPQRNERVTAARSGSISPGG
jgi:hypothetical protein